MSVPSHRIRDQLAEMHALAAVRASETWCHNDLVDASGDVEVVFQVFAHAVRPRLEDGSLLGPVFVGTPLWIAHIPKGYRSGLPGWFSALPHS